MNLDKSLYLLRLCFLTCKIGFGGGGQEDIKGFAISRVLSLRMGVGLSYVNSSCPLRFCRATRPPQATGSPSLVAPLATWHPGLEGRGKATRHPAQGTWALEGGEWQAATFPLADDLLVLLGAGGAHGRDPPLLLTSRKGG